MIFQILGFLTVVTLVWGGAHWYVGRRLLRPLELPKKLERRGWIAVFAVAAVGPLTMVTNRAFGDSSLITPLRWISYTYMGLFSLVFAGFLLRDLGLGLAAFYRRVRKAPPPDHDRRRFLVNATNAGFAGLGAMLSTWGLIEAVRVPEVTEVEVRVEGLPADLDGYRIAQITDVHIGPTIKGGWLSDTVAKVNAQGADLIAVTGDLVDGSVEMLGADVAPLGGLEAPDGVYFVTGNHEYYSGADEWCAEVARLGLTVLNNAHRVVTHGAATMIVAGVTDYRAGRHSEAHETNPDAAIADAPAADFKLMLAHQPRSIYGASRLGFDLQISGHTHAGQFFPWSLFVGLAQPVTDGLHLWERTWIYVSRGTGYWGPPNRAGVPSEITLLTLKRA
jgi:predicted MPP superfamily phosphohydrolase